MNRKRNTWNRKYRKDNTSQGQETLTWVGLIPNFSEDGVDQYFQHFEKTAINLKWPKHT